MKVHPQVFRTLKAVERLRKQRQPHILQITFGPGGIQPALGANVLTATLASTVNNYAPTGWGATVTTARLTAASGGSSTSPPSASCSKTGRKT